MLNFDELSNKVIGFALEVHKQVGPGLLEDTYKNRYKKICILDLKRNFVHFVCFVVNTFDITSVYNQGF